MKTEEERFEEWWDEEVIDPLPAEIEYKHLAMLAWLSRATLDRPKLGLKIVYRKGGNGKEVGYWIEDKVGAVLIWHEIGIRLAGRELEPGEEVEI